MPTYTAPQRDFRFIVDEFLDLGRYANVIDVSAVSPESLNGFLAGASRICETVAQPLNQSGDIEGCHWVDGRVETPKGFKEAYRRFVDEGWIGLSFDLAHGGKDLPGVLAEIFYEMLASSNMAFSGYIELSEAVFAAIRDHGSEADKRRYLPKLGSGEWTGAMHLTEPHAGSDLGLLRTRAEPGPDGTYRIHGNKAFITNAEHDLAENIVNLVLARLPGAPAGSRGTSLFIVPKFLVEPDGTLGRRNEVWCASIEHKMGLRAAPTGIINYDGAVGYLLGRPHEGLQAMFTMVNDARLGVAIQGVSIAEVAYQNAVAYARERRQGRALTPGLRGDGPADPIIVHPDVRRMLMTMRSFTEAARALALWVALQIDIAKKHPDAAERTRADGLVALLTPVIKAAFTDGGSEAANLALQCHGGHGYIRDLGIEQFVRDVRVTQVYEGTNGIQALDLVRRKLTLDRGTPVKAFLDLVAGSVASARRDAELAALADALGAALADLRGATQWMQHRVDAHVAEAASGAADYLRLFGLVALGWVWLDMAAIARRRLAGSVPDPEFYRSKLATARFFMARQVSESASLLARATLGSADLMALPDDAF